MKRDPDFFGDRELDLVYIAKRLRDALRLETLLTESGIDYAVGTNTYRGGVIFVSERTGAFFYVDASGSAAVRQAMEKGGFRPWDDA